MRRRWVSTRVPPAIPGAILLRQRCLTQMCHKRVARSIVHCRAVGESVAKREPLRPLRIPLDFDETVKALLGTPPPPKDVLSSRTVKAKKGKKRKAAKR